MKTLILSLILLPIVATAQSEFKEISDKKIQSDFLTIVKDVEVERMLGGTSQFNDCQKDNEFDVKDDKDKKEIKIQKATDCFKKKITGKNTNELKKLADNLKLENYGLIKSKNVNDITQYLASKMRKSLTGVDAETAVTQKWEDKKIIDQKVFIDLYTNQLMKSALFEVSRYCFENLRNKTNTGATNFADHWKGYQYNSDSTGIIATDAELLNITDQGKPSFSGTDLSQAKDSSDKTEVINKIVTGLSPAGQAIKPSDYQQFFSFCQKAMPKLCNTFKKQTKGNSVEATTNLTEMSNGANACLTMDRLQSIRTAMKKTEDVAKQFDEMGEDKSGFAIQMIKNPKFYERGKGANEESLDELTSVSSADMLANSDNKKLDDIEEKCKDPSKGGQECDEFLVKSDSLDKAIHNVESQMILKKEIELERVGSLEGKNEDLMKYLEENGHFELLNDFKNNNFSIAQIKTEIAKIFDARKVAEIESLKLKVGKRQVNESEMKTLVDGSTGDTKDDRIIKNIKETKEERARLAQVVMFNNIITSQLDLTKQVGNKYEKVGRNVNAWKKEMKGLEDSNAYDDKLFSGIQTDAKDNATNLDDTSIVGGGIIDQILGKKDP